MLVEELKLERVQNEIKELEVLNKAYKKAFEREKVDYSKLITAEEKDLVRLKERKKLINHIVRNLKARAEKIENLKLEGKWLKEDIKKGGKSAFDILDRTGHKPKEFFVDSKYI